MKVTGLTGGMGSGKSTVARLLAELGATIIDADKVGHEVFKPGTEAWQEVVAAFGKQILTTKGEIDRKKLGEIVFGNPELLSQLNKIMHPKMNEVVKTKFKEYRRQGVEVVVLEAPLLIEAGWASLVDEIWVTVAPQSAVLKRLTEKGLSRKEALARIHSQLSSEERIKHADVVIYNDGDLDKLKTRVRELWQRLRAEGTGKTQT
jgi:dephospho-CoA kinase